jgi:hypothetical protein
MTFRDVEYANTRLQIGREQLFGLARDPDVNIEIRDASTVCSDTQEGRTGHPQRSLHQGAAPPPNRIPHACVKIHHFSANLVAKPKQ